MSDNFNSEFNPQNGEAIYSLIFRPKKIIRNQLYNLSEKFYGEVDEAEKIKIKMEIEDYINSISIMSDYEIIKTVGLKFEFLKDDEYIKVIGDFDSYSFPNPDDIQEDKSIIGDIQKSNINDYLNGKSYRYYTNDVEGLKELLEKYRVEEEYYYD